MILKANSVLFFKALNFTQGCSALFKKLSAPAHLNLFLHCWPLDTQHHRHGNYNHSRSHPMT